MSSASSLLKKISGCGIEDLNMQYRIAKQPLLQEYMMLIKFEKDKICDTCKLGKEKEVLSK